MDYSQFREQIRLVMESKIPSDYNIVLSHIIKNNSVELDGVSIFKGEEGISPSVYLEPFYQTYLEGKGIEEIAVYILDIFTCEDGLQVEIPADFNFTYEEMKDKIVYRLVNYEKNKKLLTEIPHIRFLDLAITFHCLVRSDKDGIGTIRITNEYMERWECNTKQLFQLGEQNTPKLFPSKINLISDIIEEILRSEITDFFHETNIPKGQEAEVKEYFEDSKEFCMNKVLECRDEVQMYVLTNEKGINGASAIVYHNLIKEFAEKLKTDFYILPSSIHELILIPYSKDISKDSLLSMVCDINCTQIPEEEFLSDNVYLYKRDTNMIIL